MVVINLMWHINFSRILTGLIKTRKVYLNILYFRTCIQLAGFVLERLPAVLIKISSHYFKVKSSGIFETGILSVVAVDTDLLG
jgi:hypothetical protein